MPTSDTSILLDRRRLLLGLAAAPMFAHATLAQQYPDKVMRLVVPYAPGGSTDLAARIVAEQMSSSLRQNILVENRAGAGGVTGSDVVAKSPPDGYVLGASGGATIVLPFVLGPPAPYGPDDLIPVGQICYSEFVLAVRKDFPANNVKELISAAKENPGKFRYGESGAAIRLSVELLKAMSGTDIVRVPYKGDAPSLNDIVGGHIDMASLTVAAAAAQIRAGSVKAIGTMSKDRSRALPDVPAIAEALPGFEAGSPTMLVVPKGTPAVVLEKLNAAINDALRKPAVVEKFAPLGLAAIPMTLKEAQENIVAERKKWAQVIKDANIPVEK